MRKIILASHGSLAEGMRSAANMILATEKCCDAYGLDTYKEPEVIFHLIEEQVKREPDTQWFIITDINGGSVQNQMLHLCNFANVYVQTGMCLAMVLETMLIGQEEPAEIMMPKIVKTACENMIGVSQKTMTKSKEEELW